ncbi:MAG TPA: hypothetical protein DDY13_10590 [Cytophagales bacterium]|jgi:acetyltransferase-like isoleucine patch superfamily enzyme|nr:hypothetical protein [Cytophagales bacterium]
MSNQLRKHIKFGLIHYIRYLKAKHTLGLCGGNIYIERNVRFLRFPRNIQIEKNVVIKEGVRICPCNIDAKIKIGKNTTIGYHTFIFGSHSIEIGDDCLIAPFVYIVDSNHQIKKGMKINEQPNESAPILIGNDVWISSNVTILKGVKIGDGAVIGANSLVNQDIPEYAIFAGTPAKMIGKRQ